MNSKVSIIIPSRNEQWLEKTIDDIYENVAGDFEVIVIWDGYVPNPIFDARKNMRILYHKEPWGTRRSLNEAVSKAIGRYLFKTDAHCCFSKGFDKVLKQNHEPDWLVTLSRYGLDPEKWKITYGPVDYEYVQYPFGNPKRIGGMAPKKWIGEQGDLKSVKSGDFYWMERKKAEIKIDEIQTCNGACWFIEKQRFLDFGGLDERFWSFHNDAGEMVFKSWLSGGRVMVNKNAYHGHWWKSKERRTVPLDWDAMINTQTYMTWYWTHDQWSKQKRKFKWFVEHFWPIPGWEDFWELRVKDFQEPELKIKVV